MLPSRLLLRANAPEYLTIFRRCATSSARQKTTHSTTPKPPSQPKTETPDLNKLQPLNRPLGVLERPIARIKPRGEVVKELLTDDEAIGRERKFLVKEVVTKGYFHDLHMIRYQGGKTWIAPKVLVREDKALYLPNITGTALSDGQVKHTTSMCMGKISVLSILNSKISENHSAGFTSRTHARYSSHPLYQHIHINHQENLLKSILVKLFTSSVRSSTPVELHSTFLVSSQNLDYEKDAMGMTNNRVGYVYLIDENLRIRWGGNADAMLEEAEALEVCTGVLLKRLEKKLENEKTPKEGTSPIEEERVDADKTAV
ncbi:hypothetical protein D9758_011419 [Tetrapyrgos nigripes]|uniref:Mitochondrial ATPase complex subunit ATP10 n=1 Tax=Tetrapyrgos nigripes TaxID=182062 RepID=A0A8H5FQI4_9AGAR|nr:hypothetical protein D9758_011419 [Tetrapyrgos nigripes]